MSLRSISSVAICSFLILQVFTKVLGQSSVHTCVIGAGYSGLGAARYLQQYGVAFRVFEASRHAGGTWRFDPHVGRDEDGLPLLTSMYKNLRLNTPRQTMEFANFSAPEDTPSYPSGACFYNYLLNFTKTFDLAKNIQFRSFVTGVRRVGERWELTYFSTESRDNVTVACDYVVVASGQYHQPVWPKIQGLEDYQGRVIHSHDYKEAEPYRGRRVLLLGAGPSGLDLATQLVDVAAKLVHSHHLVYNQPNFPANYVKKPDIVSFTKTGAVFQDGSTEEFEEVIFCTGFDFEHAFLDESCGVTATSKFVLPLYRHVVNIRHPSMLFLGLPRKASTRLLDVQAQYAALLIAGKFSAPPPEVMLKRWLEHVYSLRARGYKIADVNVVGDDQDQYFAELAEESGATRVPPVVTAIRDFNGKNRLEDLLHYRDYDYQLLDDSHYRRWHNPRQGDVCLIDA